MALFGKKKDPVVKAEDTKETKTPAKKAEVKVEKETVTVSSIKGRENIARVLTSPRVTEKATLGIDKGVYVFDIAPDANKKQIKEAIKLMYNVEPVKVHVTKIAKKKTRNARTGIRGTKAGGKKAYVYLKKGDTISIM